jgi:hypothetical protein
MPEHLGQAVLDVAIAPGRVAYLIHEGSRDGFRRAAQEACTRWGGQAEPIIPVAAGGTVEDWHRQVIELAGVEAVVNVNAQDDDAAIVAGTLGLPLIRLAHIDHAPVASTFTVHPSWVDSAPTPTQAYFLAAEKAPLWQVTAAGDLTTEHCDAKQFGGPIVPAPTAVSGRPYAT